MYKEKRGQAAMEFLMTYGWAILAAVIVVGVLWYMIGNPANLVGDRATLNAPLTSEGLAIGVGTIGIEFRNGNAKSITVTDVAISGCTTNSTDFNVAAGGIGIARVDGCTGTSGDRIDSSVVISYNTSVGGLAQSGSGTVGGVVP